MSTYCVMHVVKCLTLVIKLFLPYYIEILFSTCSSVSGTDTHSLKHIVNYLKALVINMSQIPTDTLYSAQCSFIKCNIYLYYNACRIMFNNTCNKDVF